MSKISPDFVLKRSGEAVADLEFWTYDGYHKLIAAYGGQGGIDVWDLQSRRSSLIISSNIPMLSACGLPCGALLTLNKEGDLKVVDVTSGCPVNKIQLNISEVGFCKAAILSPASKRLISALPGERKSSVNVWDINEETIITQLIPPEDFKLGMVWCVKMLYPDHPLAFVGYEDGSLICWDVFERKILSKINLYSEPLMCFDVFEDVKDPQCFEGVAGSVTNDLHKWRTKFCNEELLRNQEISIVRKHRLINAGVASVKIRWDSKIVATGGWDNKIRIFSLKTLKPLAVLDYHTGTVQALSFSASKLLACGSTDKKISIWKVYDDT